MTQGEDIENDMNKQWNYEKLKIEKSFCQIKKIVVY